MKTTTVRKLLPESWGFLCPVHTPDGAPCGLLNHITISCQPLADHPEQDMLQLKAVLAQLGMRENKAGVIYPSSCLPVILDGIIIGYVSVGEANQFVYSLRHLKVKGAISKYLQIGHLMKQDPGVTKNPVYPMVFLSLRGGRFIRPVKYLPLNKV